MPRPHRLDALGVVLVLLGVARRPLHLAPPLRVRILVVGRYRLDYQLNDRFLWTVFLVCVFELLLCHPYLSCSFFQLLHFQPSKLHSDCLRWRILVVGVGAIAGSVIGVASIAGAEAGAEGGGVAGGVQPDPGGLVPALVRPLQEPLRITAITPASRVVCTDWHGRPPRGCRGRRHRLGLRVARPAVAAEEALALRRVGEQVLLGHQWEVVQPAAVRGR